MNTKRTAKVALATFGLSVMLPTAAFAATDTQGHWAGSVLAKWESQALISGYEDGTIRPDNEISRAEFVSLVNRVAGYQAAGSAVKFSDVKTGDWYAGQVAIAVNEGYIGGFEDNTFRPNDSVTRAQAAAIIARIKNLPSDAARVEQFADAAATPDWAKGVVGAVANAGYMIGDEANNFNAEKALTRAEAVAALDRVFGAKELAAQTLALSATEGVIAKGATKTITATSSVEGAVITAVSSDTDVATVTVKDGKVTIEGVEKGKATITVTAKADGYKIATATYTVDVTAAGGAGGGGGSSSGGGSSTTNYYSGRGQLTELKDAAGNIISDVKVTWQADGSEDKSTVGSSTATMTIAGSEEYTVTSATLKANTAIAMTTAGGTKYSFTLTKDYTVNSDSDSVSGNKITITAGDLKGYVDPATETALEKLGEKTVLITGAIDEANGTITWAVANDGIMETWQNIFNNMTIVLEKNVAGVVTTPKENITGLDKDTLEKVSIETTVYSDSVSTDAVTTVDLPEGVEVDTVTLPAGTEFTAAGVTITLNSGIVKTTANDKITVADVIAAINVADLDQDVQKKLEALDENRVLISCTQDGNTLTWRIDGMKAEEQQEVFALLKIALKTV